MKVSLTEEQFQRIQDKFVYESILDDIVFKLLLITENDGKTEPDMEWDFTNVKKDLDKSLSWVKTKKDVFQYIKTLEEKIKNLPEDVKTKIKKYVLYFFVGLLSSDQIPQTIVPQIEKVSKIETEMNDVEEPPSIRIRKSSESLRSHLKYEEGSITHKGEPSLVAYNLGDGAYTIGWGHAIFPNEQEGFDFLPSYENIIPKKTRITKQNAEELLNDDIREAESIINRILDQWEKDGIEVEINQNMYDAMVSMAFNIGPKIRKTRFIRAIKNGDYEGASNYILTTSSGSFDVYPGLKTRREREYKMFNS